LGRQGPVVGTCLRLLGGSGRRRPSARPRAPL